MTLIENIMDEIRSSDIDESTELESLYQSASDEERSILDEAFVHLCGWTLKTLIEQARG